jgi:hypothetical protein
MRKEREREKRGERREERKKLGRWRKARNCLTKGPRGLLDQKHTRWIFRVLPAVCSDISGTCKCAEKLCSIETAYIPGRWKLGDESRRGRGDLVGLSAE